MRKAYAHEAVLEMDPDADTNAPGGAITVELCGHWEHEPPCPLAPHHTRAVRVNRDVHLRILFATDPEQETTVRTGIDLALSGRRVRGPDGAITHWRLQTSSVSAVSDHESEHAERLVCS